MCACTTCVRLRANLALSYEKMRFRLCVCQLKQLETGPKARLHRLSPLFAHLAATCCTVGHHRWPTPLLSLLFLMICRIACTHMPNSKSVFANDCNLNLLIKHTLCHTHTHAASFNIIIIRILCTASTATTTTKLATSRACLPQQQQQ